MSVATSHSSPPDPFLVAADILDPPTWEAGDRPPLEPHQIAPVGDWNLWLLEGGRGCGKTEACSRFFARYMRMHPGSRGRIIAPTFGDAVESCINGPSGLLAMDPEIRWLPSSPGGAKAVWPNGSEVIVFGTPTPRDVERLRALGNRHIDWWEEMAANPMLKRAWDQAQLGLRQGARAIAIASTTPRGTKDYRELRALPGVELTTGITTFDNPHNSQEWQDRMRARYAGTRLGRQELAGELLEDADGALWARETIDMNRVQDAAELARVIVAIDPAATSSEDADDTGIVVAGRGLDGHAYVLADMTCHLPPDQWAQRAWRAYDTYNADRVVAEVNNGGEMVKLTLRTTGHPMSFKAVHASRGKQTRAEPVAALYEQGKVHHVVGGFAELEDQMCNWVPGEGDSPDRVDALVWAITELMLGGGGPSRIVSPQGRVPGL